MSRSSRSARAAGRPTPASSSLMQGQDMALDLLIERAVAPLRVSDDDVARFDADMAMVAGAAPWTGSGAGALAAGTAGIEPLRPEQARRLLAVLRQACAAARRGAARHAPVELAKRRAASGSGAAMPAPPFGELGELVRQGRARLRLSVFQLAHRLHVHRDYLSGLEAGERSPLALGAEGACRLVALRELSPRQVASALEQAMGVSLAEILFGRAAGSYKPALSSPVKG
jgi:hypothetical protein